MAGHSQFKNIMHRKGAQDKRRAKVFTKIIRELTVAARTGLPDPAANPRLRAAMTSARIANMPKDTIDRAVRRGAGGEDGANYEEVRYEGYGPGGIAIIAEALTDNRNRTAGEIRTAFTKSGGNLGETNSVSFMFARLGEVTYPASVAAPDAFLEGAIEAGAEDADTGDDEYSVTCQPDDLSAVRDALEAAFGPASSAQLVWRPQNSVPVAGEDTAQSLLRLVETLEDNDDVQNVFANFDIDDSLLAKLGG